MKNPLIKAASPRRIYKEKFTCFVIKLFIK